MSVFNLDLVSGLRYIVHDSREGVLKMSHIEYGKWYEHVDKSEGNPSRTNRFCMGQVESQ